MHDFQYRGENLFCEEVAISDIAASVGTPFYLYSRQTLESHFRAFDSAFGKVDHLICFSAKANSNLAVLRVFVRLGGGVDVVSGGEIYRAIQAGVKPEKIVYSGVGKRPDEIEYALKQPILMFNIESSQELLAIDQIAGKLGAKAPVALRVNPDVDPKTHPYISTGLRENKFGIGVDEAMVEYRRAAEMPNLDVSGIDCHIGSQLTSLDPFVDALDRLLLMIDKLRGEGIAIRHLDIGGGLGIRYSQENPPEPAAYAEVLSRRLAGLQLEVLLEPGRAIVGNAGVLLTRVEYLKSNGVKHFAIVDAAMNDLIRPSLYQAWQAILPVHTDSTAPTRCYDVVGPVCETGDFLGKDRDLAIHDGDLLAVRSAGAYGFCMSSNYNSRPRVAEVLVDGDRLHLARRRETVAELFQHETVLPD